MIRRTILLIYLTTLMTVAVAAPSDYRFVSVHSEQSFVNVFRLTGGAINDNGTIALATEEPGPVGTQTLYRVEGSLWTPLWQVDTGSSGGMSRMDINNNNQIAGIVSLFSTTDLILLEPNGAQTTLASRVFQCPNQGEFCNFGNLRHGLNDAGLVTITASLNHGTGPVSGVWLFGNGAPIEIVQQDSVNPGGLFNFTVPSINSAGVVAFGAREVDNPGGTHVYSGTSDSVTEEGTPGSSVSEVLISDNGDFGVAANGIHLLDDGIFTTILPAQAGVSGPNNLSFNNVGGVAFRGCIGTICGIFTGDDPNEDAVLRNGDPIFGGTVSGGGTSVFRSGNNNLNDNGEITFSVQILADGQIQSHFVRAFPLSPLYDSENDGIPNDVDNCLIADNPLQRDSDGDGFGNFCDADFDNNGVVNAVDLGLFRQNFFSADANSDLNGDGDVNAIDLGLLKLLFFSPPGPSALTE